MAPTFARIAASHNLVDMAPENINLTESVITTFSCLDARRHFNAPEFYYQGLIGFVST